jgi:hypothetical protein
VILVIGSDRDKVHPALVRRLRERGVPFRVLLEDDDERPCRVLAEEDGAGGALLRVHGGECRGEDPVGVVFVRHAVARTPEPGAVARLGAVQAELNEMMAWAACPVVNPPASAYSNYAKAYQLGLLAEAGFAVPVTLLTNSPGAARDFADALPGPAIYKGSSNVVTLAQVLTPERRARLAHLPNAPAVFQEFVRGPDLRVHVIGERCFATRLEADDEDYRRAALRGGEAAVRAAPFDLPSDLARRCVEVTRALGLHISGIDFKLAGDGRAVALELNPFPQVTFYELHGRQPIMDALVEYLSDVCSATTNVFA